MAQVLVAGAVVEVSDTAVQAKVNELKSFLDGKCGGNRDSRLRRVRMLMRYPNWVPVEAAALQRVYSELNGEAGV